MKKKIKESGYPGCMNCRAWFKSNYTCEPCPFHKDLKEELGCECHCHHCDCDSGVFAPGCEKCQPQECKTCRVKINKSYLGQCYDCNLKDLKPQKCTCGVHGCGTLITKCEPQEVGEWKEQLTDFVEGFFLNKGYSIAKWDRTDLELTKALKQFIRHLLKRQREEIVQEINKLAETYNFRVTAKLISEKLGDKIK